MIAHCLGENAPSPVAGAKKQDFKISASVMFARLASDLRASIVAAIVWFSTFAAWRPGLDQLAAFRFGSRAVRLLMSICSQHGPR
jgi:uncharacterized membrane protein YccC